MLPVSPTSVVPENQVQVHTYPAPPKVHTPEDFIQPALDTSWGNLLVKENFDRLRAKICAGDQLGLRSQVWEELQLSNCSPGWDRSFCYNLWISLNSNCED